MTAGEDATPTELPPHRGRWLYGAIVAMGILMFAQAALAALTGTLFIVVPAIGVGLAAWLYGTRGLRLAEGVQHLNAAHDLLAQGRLAEVERVLAAPVLERLPLLSASASHERALVALRRGDVAAALAHADRALATPLGWFSPATSRLGRLRARSLCALLRASLGDVKGAREDGEVVRQAIERVPLGLQLLGQDEVALLEPLARVELAEAVALARSGGRDVLREHLARTRGILMEGCSRREREIVRAYEQMLAAKGTTPYRQRREAAPAAGEERARRSIRQPR